MKYTKRRLNGSTAHGYGCPCGNNPGSLNEQANELPSWCDCACVGQRDTVRNDRKWKRRQRDGCVDPYGMTANDMQRQCRTMGLLPGASAWSLTIVHGYGPGRKKKCARRAGST